MFRKTKRKAKSTLRKRTTDGDDKEEEEDNTVVIVPTVGGRKRPGKDDEDDSKKETDTGGRNSLVHEYGSSRSGPITQKEMATRTAEYHPKQSQPSDTATNTIPTKKAKTNGLLAGPLAAPTFVRTTCRFDYQPDICKDYKETGFCGFGDTCIYLHDRGDTMTGWQLEKEWEARKQKERKAREAEMEKFVRDFNNGGQKREKDGESDGDDEDNEEATTDDDGFPFACHICRSVFKEPVVTSCGHYFCSDCISKRVRGDQGTATTLCPICDVDTHGVFNYPYKLFAKKRKVCGVAGTWKEFAERKKTGKKTTISTP